MAFSAKQEMTYLFCYCAGHGCQDVFQYFIVNSDEKNCFQIETTLRSIGSSLDCVHIFAINDMCRSKKSNFAGLRGDPE